MTHVLEVRVSLGTAQSWITATDANAIKVSLDLTVGKVS